MEEEYMFLDLMIKFNKQKLDNMIENNVDYEFILKQSQKLDKYITKKTVIMLEQKDRLNSQRL